MSCSFETLLIGTVRLLNGQQTNKRVGALQGAGSRSNSRQRFAGKMGINRAFGSDRARSRTRSVPFGLGDGF